jgi:hypothetical protein
VYLLDQVIGRLWFAFWPVCLGKIISQNWENYPATIYVVIQVQVQVNSKISVQFDRGARSEYVQNFFDGITMRQSLAAGEG